MLSNSVGQVSFWVVVKWQLNKAGKKFALMELNFWEEIEKHGKGQEEIKRYFYSELCEEK